MVVVLAAVALQPISECKKWGLEAVAAVRREFAMSQSPFVCDALEPGKPKTPLFNWGAGVWLSALNGAARADASWQPELRKFADAIRGYWNPAPPVAGFDVLPLPKPADRYYDDNAWMALALAESSEILGDPRLLALARSALDFALSGEDAKLGGGIYWREQEKTSKNTCSNAPTAAACLALYRRTGDPILLAAARRLYTWTRAKFRDPSDGLYWDSQALDGKMDTTKWSYNSALMIRTAAELARITGEESYRNDAESLAQAAQAKWLVGGRLRDVGRFAHLLVESWTFAPSPQRHRSVTEALRWLRAHGRDKRGLYGPWFDRPAPQKDGKWELLDTASAARAFFIASESS